MATFSLWPHMVFLLYIFLSTFPLLIRTSDFPGGSDGKASAYNAGDLGSIPGSGRSPGEDLLEKEMVTHSSILAWKIPWTEKPGRLQAMGSKRVGHD